MSHYKNLPLVLNGIMSLLGIGMLLVVLLVNSIELRAIFICVGTGATLLAIFRWVTLFFIPLPEGHCKRFAVSLSWFPGGLYYVLYGQSIVWIALAWILILIGFWAMVGALQRILIENALLRRLWKTYRQSALPDLPVPFAYIHAEAGLGVYFAQRLVAKIMKSLWEHQYLSPKSGLRVYMPQGNIENWWRRYLWKYRQRGMILFLVSDSVRRYPGDFRKWLASHAATFILVCTPAGTIDSYTKSFEEEVDSGYHLCLGPIFTIWVRPFGKGTFLPRYKCDQVLESSWGLQDRSLGSVVAPLSNRLASTVLPIAASDSRLNRETRLVIQEIAVYAVPPVANSYLRFRLAQSDVERFLSLLDSVESLLRFSVIVLLINRWIKTDRDKRIEKLIRSPLTLGSWIHLLQNLTKSTVRDKLAEEICCFWKAKIFQTQEDLINKVTETGLYSIDCRGYTQLNWLEWFRDLRNVTRGHGVVEESSIAPFWHILHETFVEMVSALRSLILSSYLVAAEPSGREIVLRGWFRDKSQYDLDYKSSEDEMLVFLKLGSIQKLLLYPFIIIREHNVFIFDHLRTKDRAISFLDYRSGECRQFPFSDVPEIDLYEVWNRKNQWLGAKFKIQNKKVRKEADK